MNIVHAPFKFLLLCALSTVIAACNDDVFIDDTKPSAEKLTLDGSGATASLTFQTDLLTALNVNTPYDFTHQVYYSADGRVVRESEGYTIPIIDRTASYIQTKYVEVTTEDDLSFKVELNGNEITLTELDNPYGISMTGHIELEYEYKIDDITFSISPAQPSLYRITDITYNSDRGIDFETRSITSPVLTYINSTPNTSYTKVTPGKNRPMQVLFNIDKRSIEFTEEMPEVEIPTYPLIDEVDGIYMPGFHGIKVRFSTETIKMDPLDPEFNKTYSTEVEPYSSKQAILRTDFGIARAYGNIRAVNTLSGREIDIAFTVGVSQPFLFNLKWIDIPYEEE